MDSDREQAKGRIERTFTGDAPTGENVVDTTGPEAVPGMDVGASELPTRGDLGFPGSPNEELEELCTGPIDVGAMRQSDMVEDSPR